MLKCAKNQRYKTNVLRYFLAEDLQKMILNIFFNHTAFYLARKITRKKISFCFFTLCMICMISFTTFILSGCTEQGPFQNFQSPFVKKDLRLQANQIAEKANFRLARIKTQSFVLTTYQKNKEYGQSSSVHNTEHNSDHNIDHHADTLTIYIEGDGNAWASRRSISEDPTPKNPLALKLAVLDPSPNVAYLARPCQYTPHDLNRACTADIWTDSRFSEMVIDNMNQAVEQLKEQYQAKRIQLVGFSGGAAVAVLIAARRNDVINLKTVAGDLDHQALSGYHKTTPLGNSLNPKAVAYQLIYLPQYHFAGEKDKTVPPFIAEQFVSEVLNGYNRRYNRSNRDPNNSYSAHSRYIQRRTLHAGRHVKFFMVKGATHHERWEEIWPNLLKLQ